MTPELYWIPVSAGRLAIMARPRAGEWLRDEIHAWREAGIERVVSLLEPAEVRDLELDDEARLCAAAGIEFISFPIRDRGVPSSVPVATTFVEALASSLQTGSSVAIHCRAGIGRSSLIAACILHRLGVAPDEAFEMISRARGVAVPDTPEQKEWLVTFARN